MTDRVFVGGPDHTEEYARIPLVWCRSHAPGEEEFVTLPELENGDSYEVTPLALKQLLLEAGFAPYEVGDET